VNETMARRYWPNARAVGRQFRFSDGPPLEVVGVAHDVKYRMLREEAGPSFYCPIGQTSAPHGGVLHVRTVGDPAPLLDTLRRTLAGVDPVVAITSVRTLREQADLNVNDERMAMTIGVALGAAALLLAAVGLYGTMAYSVSQRHREIGVRIALGAAPDDVRRLILRQGIHLAFLGSALGVGLAFWIGQLIRARLFGVTPADAISFTASVLILAAVALLASVVPARRASKVDPVETLRMG
jgi:ABC-type antimicrobial peptide transport system permease subunit